MVASFDCLKLLCRRCTRLCTDIGVLLTGGGTYSTFSRLGRSWLHCFDELWLVRYRIWLTCSVSSLVRSKFLPVAPLSKIFGSIFFFSSIKFSDPFPSLPSHTYRSTSRRILEASFSTSPAILEGINVLFLLGVTMSTLPVPLHEMLRELFFWFGGIIIAEYPYHRTR